MTDNLHVIRFGRFNYAIRRGNGELWWSGSDPNWSDRYWTRFWFKRSAVMRAKKLSGAYANDAKVVWSANQ